jgi:hypothetical protein
VIAVRFAHFGTVSIETRIAADHNGASEGIVVWRFRLRSAARL